MDFVNGGYIPLIDLSKTVVPKKILSIVPEHVARHCQAVPVKEEDGQLIIAMIEPNNQEAVDFIQKKTGKKLILKACTQAGLNHVLDQYGQFFDLPRELEKIVSSTDKEIVPVIQEELIETSSSQNKKGEIILSIPAAEIIRTFFNQDITDNISGIQLEIIEDKILIKFQRN